MKLYYEENTYRADGSLAIQAYEYDKEYGGYIPYGMVTVCLVDYGMTPNENEIFIPTYKMTEPFIAQVMLDLVDEVLGTVPIGMGEGLRVRLKDDWRKHMKTMY